MNGSFDERDAALMTAAGGQPRAEVVRKLAFSAALAASDIAKLAFAQFCKTSILSLPRQVFLFKALRRKRMGKTTFQVP
ncbi:hypothetical protein [Leisingera sp. JC11]|uniref:hypothetical protein n=1 Tax=Leisingera sp. JC11 TaxID=3042469 RepID=UPI00345258FD